MGVATQEHAALVTVTHDATAIKHIAATANLLQT